MLNSDQALTDRQTNRRLDWIISLRAIAPMAVVFIHVIGMWRGESWGDRLTGVRLIFAEVIVPLLTRWAVPCFLMMSGTLLLNPQKDLGMNKIFRYIMRMVMVLATFGFGFCIIEVIIENGYKINAEIIFTAFKNLIAGSCWEHMWYVYRLIGLYMLTPILRAFTKLADKKEVQFTLGILFLFTIVRPTVIKLFDVYLYDFVPISTYCVFFYLLGYYLFKEGLDKSIKRTLLLSGTLGFVVMLLLKLNGANVECSGENVFAAIYSIGIYSFSIDNQFLKEKAKNKIIQSLSKYSFGIYILHEFFLNVMYKGLKVYPSIFPIVIGELLFWLIAFGGAYAATWIICKIKIFKQILT